MDLSNFSPIDEPARMELIDPRTGDPARDDDGNVPALLLYSVESEVVQRRQRERAARRINRQQRLRTPQNTTGDDLLRDQVDALVEATAGWEHISFEGSTDFSPDRARAVYMRFASIRMAAQEFILNSANFTRKPSDNVSITPGGTSNSDGSKTQTSQGAEQ